MERRNRKTDRSDAQANNRLTIAGQIPLLPRTLTFATPRDVLFDAVLALQHVRRIIEVMGDSSKGGAGWIGRGWIEGVVGWYVGDEEVERAMRAVWDDFAERVSAIRVD
jgi:diphthine-ammonia ligase